MCNWTVSALNFITDSYISYIFLIVFRTSSVDFRKKCWHMSFIQTIENMRNIIVS